MGAEFSEQVRLKNICSIPFAKNPMSGLGLF